MRWVTSVCWQIWQLWCNLRLTWHQRLLSSLLPALQTQLWWRCKWSVVVARQEDFQISFYSFFVNIKLFFLLYFLHFISPSFSLSACNIAVILQNVKCPVVHSLLSLGWSQVTEMSNMLPKLRFASFRHVNHWLNLHKANLPGLRNNRCGWRGWTKYPTLKHTGDTRPLLHHLAGFCHSHIRMQMVNI